MNARILPSAASSGAMRLAGGGQKRHLIAMLNILSFVIGLLTLIVMIPTIIPLTGWLNWLLVPVALFGALIGMISAKNGGRNFCLIVAGLGALRLFLGGGIF